MKKTDYYHKFSDYKKELYAKDPTMEAANDRMALMRLSTMRIWSLKRKLRDLTAKAKEINHNA